jgi:hypothetical protein
MKICSEPPFTAGSDFFKAQGQALRGGPDFLATFRLLSPLPLTLGEWGFFPLFGEEAT